MFTGFVLIALGLIFMLQNLGYLPGDFWGLFAPAIIIALGLALVLKRGNRCGWCGKMPKE